MTVRIRALTEEDQPEVLAIARSLAAWFRPLDQMALVIDLREHEGLVAVAEEQVVGFLTYYLINARTAELSWFGVDPAVQSRGIGTRLLERLESDLAGRGIRHLELNTVPADYDPTFATTNEFYRRHGFVLAERDDNFYAHERPGIKLVKTLSK